MTDQNRTYHKPPLSLVPQTAIVAEAVAFAAGLRGDRKPLDWRETRMSLMDRASAVGRHMAAWIDGEDLDEETGASNLALARCQLAIMLDLLAQGNAIDDRPPSGKSGEMIRKLSEG